MKFNLSKEFIKMLEIMDKSPQASRFIWFIAFSTVLILLVRFSPELIKVIIEWQQIGKA
ncbi:hypothetical protein M3703_07120 [Mannheimia haemolytica]|uniref:hypothetical protein n=1 Tax=Mannheimia haemolytica TaxID=75985 RepID=UPI00201BB362|nr:hypothetical protein [Mannheimia haemolytica]UQX78655.1 hypothetical protein M3703_07120 [Mannheimia haemolytica]